MRGTFFTATGRASRELDLVANARLRVRASGPPPSPIRRRQAAGVAQRRAAVLAGF